MMRSNVENTCKEHPDRNDCPDCLITYIPKWDVYGIIIHDGGSSFIKIKFCPWCGFKLPESKFERRMNELEAMGFDFEDPDAELPAGYEDDTWWRNPKPKD